MGVYLMHFLNFVCVLGVYLGEFGILRSKIPPPPEIA